MASAPRRGDASVQSVSSMTRPPGSIAAAAAIGLACDVGERTQVRELIQEATRRFGRIDVLINNAGVITVGPLETQTLDDFERSMAIIFWGAVYPTLEVLPQMRARRAGRIVTITS